MVEEYIEEIIYQIFRHRSTCVPKIKDVALKFSKEGVDVIITDIYGVSLSYHHDNIYSVMSTYNINMNSLNDD